MKNFLLSLFILFNIIWYDFKIIINSSYMCVTNAILKFLTESVHFIVALFQAFWRFIKYVTWPFRHALYEYVVITFIACTFITIKYPDWYLTDYTWIVFFFVLMATLAVAAIRDK